MCMLNFRPYDEDGPDYPLPRGRPRVAWVVPINMYKLGASLQALTDTAPQTTTSRLCHRFRDGPLSRLPQELLEPIVTEIQRVARAKFRPEWYQDSVCWQGTCLDEDHYSVYGDHVEELWQKIYIKKQYGKTWEKKVEGKADAEKAGMVQDWIRSDPRIFSDMDGYTLHVDARFRWLERICLCLEDESLPEQTPGHFVPLNNILKSRFGLEAIIHHEQLSEEMYNFLPNNQDSEEHAYYTTCYLTLAQTLTSLTSSDGIATHLPNKMFDSGHTHTAFRQTLDLSMLSISEKQRFRFTRAMKQLNLKPEYQLSELEPLIVHPIQDENLANICSCREFDCPGSCFDIHSWDRPYCLEQTLKIKSKELAKESWPKLMQLAASDAVVPFDWDE